MARTMTDQVDAVREVSRARNGDDLLTALAGVDSGVRRAALGCCTTRVLREAADLCMADAQDMTARQAIDAILTGF